MYARIYEQIFSSSIMEEDLETRYIWFCLLTLADREGFVDMTIPAIARRINIEEISVSNAITKFMAPDPSSRTDTAEGRRIEKIRESFGWKIINYIQYRDLRNEENRREYMRDYMRKTRDVNKKANTNANKFTVSTCKPPLAHTATATATATATKDTIVIPKTSLAFLWNALSVNLPKVISVSEKRKKQEKLRLSERTIEKWKEVFEKINSSEFCKGNNNTGWKATYDWIISNTDNSLKVLEGKYDGQIGRGKQPSPEKERGISKYANLECETINTDDPGTTGKV